jgi:hypothetical protein
MRLPAIGRGMTISNFQFAEIKINKKQQDSRCRALKPAGRPLPHCRGGNGPPSATRCLRGGRGSCGFQEHSVSCE